MELVDASGDRRSLVKYPLDIRSGSYFGAESQQVRHSRQLPALPVSSAQELQVAIITARQEIMDRAGLQSLGVAASIGRGRLEHILRIAPGTR